MSVGGGKEEEKHCCISHEFYRSASRNPRRIAVVHPSGDLERNAEEVSSAKGSAWPPLYPGDDVFTCGEILSAVESLSRRIRRVLDGGDDPDLVRKQGHSSMYRASCFGSDAKKEISSTGTDRVPQIVGVYAPPSVEYIVAVLSVLRCGEAFLPLDPLWSQERILSAVSSSKASLIIISQISLSEGSQGFNAVYQFAGMSTLSVFYLNRRALVEQQLDQSDLVWPCEKSRKPQKFCYVMYTSGSTGKPKGVCGTESVRWEIKLEGRIECSAALTGDFHQVVVGCYKGKIYFLNSRTGNVCWTFQTGGEVKMQPVVDKQRNLIWCGSHDHHLYAFNYKDHCCIYRVSCGGSIYGSPYIDMLQDMLYVASTSGCVTAISLEVSPFSVIWLYEAGAPIFGSLAMDSQSRNIICCLVNGQVIMLNSKGAVVWKATVDGPIFAGGCVSSVLPNQVLICSRNGSVFSFDMKGALLWEYQVGDPITASAFVDEQIQLISATSQSCERFVSICTSSGRIHVIRIKADAKQENNNQTDFPENLMVQRFAIMDLPGEVFSSPVMIGGHIFVGCRDDYVHCILVML